MQSKSGTGSKNEADHTETAQNRCPYNALPLLPGSRVFLSDGSLRPLPLRNCPSSPPVSRLQYNGADTDSKTKQRRAVSRIGKGLNRMPITHIKRPTGRNRENWSDKRLRADPQIRKDYGDLLALYPDHPLRWKRNALACWLCDRGAKSRTDLNAMAVAYYQDKAFPLEDYTRFYRDIGYSLSGFIEVFGEALGLYAEAE